MNIQNAALLFGSFCPSLVYIYFLKFYKEEIFTDFELKVIKIGMLDDLAKIARISPENLKNNIYITYDHKKKTKSLIESTASFCIPKSTRGTNRCITVELSAIKKHHIWFYKKPSSEEFLVFDERHPDFRRNLQVASYAISAACQFCLLKKFWRFFIRH